MRSRNRTIDIFNISMLDVISGALGAFLLIMLILMRFYEPNVVNELNAMQKEMAQAQEAMKSQAAMLEEAQQRLQAAEADAARQAQDLQQRLGFALKETEIVFVLDVSGSMKDNDGVDGLSAKDEDRFTQVISGIKMLVATMSEQYSIEVVYFPGQNGPADAMFGQLRQVTDAVKLEIYRRLQELPVGGATPTGEAMTMVLGPRYDAARTVVLLSDGEPCRLEGNSCIKLLRPDLASLAERLAQAANGGRKTINAIGVGSAFRIESAASADAVFFLRTLADRTDGFYIGF